MKTSIFERLRAQSPKSVKGLTPQDLLTRLSSPGQSFLVKCGLHADKDQLWKHGEPLHPSASHFWLLAMTTPAQHQAKEWISENEYFDWTYATTEIPNRHLTQLEEAMTSGRLNVAALIQAENGVHAVVRVDAATESEWVQKIPEVSNTFLELGLDPPKFKKGNFFFLPLENPQTGEGTVLYLA